jgi:hypothetical protein
MFILFVLFALIDHARSTTIEYYVDISKEETGNCSLENPHKDLHVCVSKVFDVSDLEAIIYLTGDGVYSEYDSVRFSADYWCF